MAIEKQNAKINAIKHQIAIEEAKADKASDTLRHISSELDELESTKSEIDETVYHRMKLIRSLLTVFIIITFAASIAVSFFWNLWLAIVPFAVSVYSIIVGVWKNESISIFSILLNYEKKYYRNQCELRRYSESKVTSLNTQKESCEQELKDTKTLIQTLTEQLKAEEAKNRQLFY